MAEEGMEAPQATMLTEFSSSLWRKIQDLICRITTSKETNKAPGIRTWTAQAMEAREKMQTFSSIQKKLKEIYRAMQELSSGTSTISELEREDKMAKLKQDRAALMRESSRVASQIKTPDYSGMSEAERAEEAERIRQEAMDDARRLLEVEGDHDGSLMKQCRARVVDLDPKQGGVYFNRMPSSLPEFDLDEESPFGPMRFTYTVYENGDTPEVCEAVNILSVKIASLDVAFTIQVYGSVIARDSIDHKCVYLFRRDRDHCQRISSKDEPLILTGPKRGLALLDDNYVETDLKIKDDHQGKQDRQLSKGVLTIRGIAGRSLDKCTVETKSIATRLSTVDVMYAVVVGAVEGTIGIRVLQGEFYGTITAHTTSIQERTVLYDDTKVAGAKTTRHARRGAIQLTRPVVSVYVRDKLIIDAKTSDGKSERLEFTPMCNGGERAAITLGATKMRVKVAWSIMDP